MLDKFKIGTSIPCSRLIAKHKNAIYYVYRLKSKKGKKSYIGVSNNPITRIQSHFSGYGVRLDNGRKIGKPENWLFQILEVVDASGLPNNRTGRRKFVGDREFHYIDLEIKANGRNNVLNNVARGHRRRR